MLGSFIHFYFFGMLLSFGIWVLFHVNFGEMGLVCNALFLRFVGNNGFNWQLGSF